MLNNMKGFTLIEIVVAIFLLTVGTVGAFSLIQQTIAFTSIASSQLTATYMAQEGIEIIRNIRDTNYLEKTTNPSVTWDEGISSSNWQVVNFLDGSQSKFQRQITIEKTPLDSPNKMVVSVEVKWSERGRTHQVMAATELYKWR